MPDDRAMRTCLDSCWTKHPAIPFLSAVMLKEITWAFPNLYQQTRSITSQALGVNREVGAVSRVHLERQRQPWQFSWDRQGQREREKNFNHLPSIRILHHVCQSTACHPWVSSSILACLSWQSLHCLVISLHHYLIMSRQCLCGPDGLGR